MPFSPRWSEEAYVASFDWNGRKSNSRKKHGLDEGENSLQDKVGEKRKERVGLASIFKKRNTS